MTSDARAPQLSLAVDDSLRGALALGLLEAEDVRLEPVPREFDEECVRTCARLVEQHGDRAPADIPGVAETRTLFHRLGVDPTKTRPSSEALLRRVVQGKGLPPALAAGVQQLSGADMSDVRVHAGSPQPAQVGALAYAQGNDIHLASGQERHLPHEAWHVAQQKAGRVQPTVQAAGVPINDSPALEAEADRMGARALEVGQRVAAQRSRRA